MKTLVYTGIKELSDQNHPQPVSAEGKVHVQNEASGIYVSDTRAILGHDNRRPASLTLNHKAAATVTGDAQGTARHQRSFSSSHAEQA